MPGSKKNLLVNAALLVVSVITALLIAEVYLRFHYLQEVDPLDFSHVQFIGFINETQVLNDIKRDAMQYGVENNLDTSLFDLRPYVRTYGKERSEVQHMLENLNGGSSIEIMKQWNSNFVNEAYTVDSLRDEQNHFNAFTDKKLYTFKAYDSTAFPVYRYFANATMPYNEIRFNNFGWTGSDIAFKKPANTIRIAFLGGSTTQQYPDLSYGYPDCVERWLDEWARKEGLNIDFEVINAGRVALRSTDIAAILKYEVLPVAPDIVVYYEGRNQFDANDIIKFPPNTNFSNNITYNIIGRSILIQFLMHQAGISYYSVLEKQKPSVLYLWPKAVNEADPDINVHNLPLQLDTIVTDLDTMLSVLDTAHQTLVLTSFAMETDDSLINCARYNYVYNYWLNDFMGMPLSYITRLNNFENRVFEKYAASRNIPFADVAPELRKRPECFSDGIHMDVIGIRMQAWITFSKLLPIIKQKLKEGKLPYQQQQADSHPYIKDDAQLVDLTALEKKQTK